MVLSVVVRIIEHMFRSYQYVLHPTARQGRALEHLLAMQCEAYNAALEERRDAKRQGVLAGSGGRGDLQLRRRRVPGLGGVAAAEQAGRGHCSHAERQAVAENHR
jgi:hypothetical protein